MGFVHNGALPHMRWLVRWCWLSPVSGIESRCTLLKYFAFTLPFPIKENRAMARLYAF